MPYGTSLEMFSGILVFFLDGGGRCPRQKKPDLELPLLNGLLRYFREFQEGDEAHVENLTHEYEKENSLFQTQIKSSIK